MDVSICIFFAFILFFRFACFFFFFFGASNGQIHFFPVFFPFLTFLFFPIYLLTFFFQFWSFVFWFSMCFPFFCTFFSSLKIIRISNWGEHKTIYWFMMIYDDFQWFVAIKWIQLVIFQLALTIHDLRERHLQWWHLWAFLVVKTPSDSAVHSYTKLWTLEELHWEMVDSKSIKSEDASLGFSELDAQTSADCTETSLANSGEVVLPKLLLFGVQVILSLYYPTFLASIAIIYK